MDYIIYEQFIIFLVLFIVIMIPIIILIVIYFDNKIKQERLYKSTIYNKITQLKKDLDYYYNPIIIRVDTLRKLRKYDKSQAIIECHDEIIKKYEYYKSKNIVERFREIINIPFSDDKYTRNKEHELIEIVRNQALKAVVVRIIYISPKGRSSASNDFYITTQDLSEWEQEQEAQRIYKLSEQYRRKKERGKLTPGLRYDILKRDNFKCQICGRTQEDGITLEVDHKIPIAKGGKTEPDNLWTLCRDCNRGKSNKYKGETASQFISRIKSSEKLLNAYNNEVEHPNNNNNSDV